MTTNRATSPTATANPGTKRAGSKARTRQAKTAAEPTQLRLLDGGRTSRKAWQLDARTRERIADLLAGLLAQDTDRLLRALDALEIRGEHVDSKALRRDAAESRRANERSE